VLAPDEPLQLKVIILAPAQPDNAVLRWRELGRGDFAEVPLEKIGRGVYKVSCPRTTGDVEYCVRARFDRTEVYFPVTAPLLNQTAVRLQPES
jgi:hypothetical protein